MWKVPKIWEGGECWIIGGGPSLTEQFNIPMDVVQKVIDGIEPLSTYSPYLSPIHNKHVIGINIAYLLGNWIDILFFGDKRFFLEHRTRLAEFSGIKATSVPNLNQGRYKQDHLKYLIKHKNKGKGISEEPSKICWNANSGAAAISIAANAGAKRIILVGFDMKMGVEKSLHWHSEYYKNKKELKIIPRKLPFSKHLVGFKFIAEDASKRGIEIINACPDSAIEQFRKTTVKELLNGQA